MAPLRQIRTISGKVTMHCRSNSSIEQRQDGAPFIKFGFLGNAMGKSRIRPSLVPDSVAVHTGQESQLDVKIQNEIAQSMK